MRRKKESPLDKRVQVNMLKEAGRTWPVQCQFRYYGTQCPLPAISRDPDGKAWCEEHGSPDNRDLERREPHIRRFMQRVACKAEARKILEARNIVRPQDLVEQQLKDHPEWDQQLGETADAYHARMRAHVESLGFKLPARRR